MPGLEQYELARRDALGEEWRLRGRLRELFREDAIEPLEGLLRLSTEVLKGRGRTLRRIQFGGRPYILKTYKAGPLGGGRVRRRALAQLEVGMDAVGRGLAVVPVEAACARPPWTCLFVPEQIGWSNLSTVLHDPGLEASTRWRVLEAFARFVRRLHEEGLFQENPGLGHFQARVRPTGQDFQLEDLDGAEFVDPLPDEAREEMLGGLLASYRDGLTNGMRFLRAYVESDEIAREVAPEIFKDLRSRLRTPRRPSRPKLGRLVLDPFKVRYVVRQGARGIDSAELQRLYKAGLKDPALRVVRVEDVLAAWKTALGADASSYGSPIACFARPKSRAGFVLYRRDG